MNLSGKAFRYWKDKNIDLENTPTIVDEITLPLDKLRLRPSGMQPKATTRVKDIEFMLWYRYISAPSFQHR